MSSFSSLQRCAAGLVCLAAACGRKPIRGSSGDGEAAFQTNAEADDSDPEAEVFPGTTCHKVGCAPGVDVVVHLAATPAVLARSGSFHACHRGQCWDSGFAAPLSPGAPSGCIAWLGGGRACMLVAEEGGSRLTLLLASDDAIRAGARGFVDGDVVSLRIDAGGTTLLDLSRPVRYVDAYPNGRRCPPRCRGASIEVTSDVHPPPPPPAPSSPGHAP